MSPGEPKKQPADQDVLEIYKMLVEMADRVSQRRQSANSFYLTVNTAIIGGAAYLSQSQFGHVGTLAVSAAGIAICSLWTRAVVSYKSLNAAKFEVITALEERLPVSPYKDEWAILTSMETERSTSRFTRLRCWCRSYSGSCTGPSFLRMFLGSGSGPFCVRRLIPILMAHDPCAHSWKPIVMMRQG